MQLNQIISEEMIWGKILDQWDRRWEGKELHICLSKLADLEMVKYLDHGIS